MLKKRMDSFIAVCIFPGGRNIHLSSFLIKFEQPPQGTKMLLINLDVLFTF